MLLVYFKFSYNFLSSTLKDYISCNNLEIIFVSIEIASDVGLDIKFYGSLAGVTITSYKRKHEAGMPTLNLPVVRP
jgi:hypothetical protein